MDSKYLSAICAGFLCMVSNKPLATTVRIESQYPSEEK